MDLLRAAILGPSGTPYHDGLFVFDIRLPADYPASPPEVFYHSWGLRVNPVRQLRAEHPVSISQGSALFFKCCVRHNYRQA